MKSFFSNNQISPFIVEHNNVCRIAVAYNILDVQERGKGVLSLRFFPIEYN